jgi:UDPglucose--hexose-1-phosphate uridylyltransferase
MTGGVSKSTGVLADGREIIYFDESPGQFRADVQDARDLPARDLDGPIVVSADAGLRWDPLLGEWVMLAAQRQDRTFLPPADLCPLCPSRAGRLTEIPAGSYDVAVFENRFPSLRGAHAAADHAAADHAAASPGGYLGAQRPAFGRCEVVCFTSDHDASFASLAPRRARTVLEAWADRTTALGGMAGVAQVYCFENRGQEVGVTLSHPHGQIYAFPFVTPRTERMLEQARRHRRRSGRNLFDDIVASELAAGARVVARNEHWIAFVPEAARWPFEVMAFPAVRVPDIPALNDAARSAFCDLYLDVLGRLDAMFGIQMPYIAAWHQAPGGDLLARAEFGLHLQIMAVRRAPRKLKYLAGTESGMGAWINDIAPEAAAARLRAAR